MIAQRMHGLNECKSELALFCDDDVEFRKDFVKTLYEPSKQGKAEISVGPLLSFLVPKGIKTVASILSADNVQTVNRGAIAETFVGTELVKAGSAYTPQPLFCWHREKAGSNAEVDYVVQLGSEIFPIEVKSGSKGSMQSLRIFLQAKNLTRGIRTSMENFAAYDDILLYPLYGIANIREKKETNP